MPAPMSNTTADDALGLERVAVGPYCVFDAFKPPLNPDDDTHAESVSPVKNENRVMEAPIMTNGFAFSNGVPPTWLTSSGDQVPLTAAAAEDFGNSEWSEWMQWDPASSQSAQVKPLNAQGPICFRRLDQKPLPFNRRQNSESREPSHGLQLEEVATSVPLQAQINEPYTFGGEIQIPSAFDFDSNPLSSPSSGGGQQHSGFYSPPMWDQQGARESSMFTSQGLDQSLVSSAPAPPVSTPSLHHSPSSANNEHTSSSSATSSPEPMQHSTKKRKASSEESDNKPATKKEKQPPVKKTAHNMIEKRYRNNLNDKIAALRDSVPSLRVMSRANGGNEEDDDPEDLEGLTPAHKLNKATVLSKATEYIRHLEKRNKRLQDEVNTLNGRLESYEKMAISGQLALHGPGRTPDGTRYHEDPFGHPSALMPQPVSAAPQGLIPVPESMASLHRGHPPQPHYAQQAVAYPQFNGAGRPGAPGAPLVNGRRSSAMMGKLMVGSLAGLMVLEGFSAREQSSEQPAGRGLFALPVHLLGILTPQITVGASSAHLSLARPFLLFMAIFYIVAPLLDFRPKPKKKPAAVCDLSQVPSLASPVELRRQAWLTAIQTVWVPQHNFWLEAAALGMKTLKLSTRRIIGWHGYALLTGITKEQEAARIKAWNIALDAQLTGGDAEISKSRLVHTLMASGTLPDTPARLMLKALHLRVLLWELANTGHGGWRILDDFSAKLARNYWNAARSEQKIALNLASSPNPDSDAEPLPEHLAALLEMECDDVLIPDIVQRAYNLAWNRPSAERTTQDESMDSVVEDFSICSPLDALAAWWSCYILKGVLGTCLASADCTPKESVKSGMDLACRTAPPTSQARLRALVAQAIVLDEDRSSRLTSAVQALPSAHFLSPSLDAGKSPRGMLMNPVGDPPISTDIRKALTLAKCLALIESKSTRVEARRRAIFVINNSYFQETTTTIFNFVAGYKVLNRFTQDPELQAQCSQGLERLASSLRMWIGHETGRRSGVSNKVRGHIISRCLDVSKMLVGLADPEEIDDGYVSSSIKGD